MALEVPWYLRVTNSEVYGRLSRVTETIRGRRLRLAGHVEELIARDLLFWDPTHVAWESWAWKPKDDLRRRAEEGHRAREPSRDPEADAGPGALEAVHHVSDVEAALSQ